MVHGIVQLSSVHGRRLSKSAHSNPIAVLDLVCSQLKSYDNLIGMAVDAMKYVVNAASGCDVGDWVVPKRVYVL